MSREEKLEYWSMIVEEFESSGKSIRSQCRANGFTYAQYYDWRKKVRPTPAKSLAKVEPAGFVEVSAPKTSLKNSGVYIEFQDKFRISLEENFNPKVLISAIQTLHNKL